MATHYYVILCERPLINTLQDLFNSAFDKFEYTGNFGLFQKDNYIIFHVENYIPLNLLVFIPAILLGGIGGVLGALFTFLNLKVSFSSKWNNIDGLINQLDNHISIK